MPTSMHITNLWHPGLRIIEFGAASGRLADALIGAGYQQFLSVVRGQAALDRIAAAHPRLQSRITVARSRQAVRRNNGEVLILRGSAGLHLARYRSIRHAQYAALPVDLSPSIIPALLAALVQWLLGRLTRPLLLDVSKQGDRSLRLIVFGVRKRRAAGARRYIPHALGVERFLRRLNRHRARYAVLRWFETLPVLPPGEDLDILVDDADLPLVSAMLDEGPGLEPIDLYSATGLPGVDYCGMPYYPPYLAQQLLDRARPLGDLCWVPSPEDHFLSLAYHALYHKGTKSGLKVDQRAAAIEERPEHDYQAVLGKLARKLGIETPVTLADLDRYLDERGWRPPHDMLVRLSRRNAWVRSLLHETSNANNDQGLAVFVLREKALARGGVEKAKSLIARHGFCVLRAEALAGESLQAVSRSIRGGNWGQGPWPISGGVPAAVVVAYDTSPIAPTRRQRKKFPFLTNGRLLCKDKIRDAFNHGLPPSEHCNTIHSSDNGREALDYLRLMLPAAADELLAQIDQMRGGFHTQEPVLATWTRAGRRAKIELVERQRVLAVKKTFKPGYERFCEREVAALRDLHPVVPEVPRLLEASESSVTIPYYERASDYQRSSGKLLPLSIARQAIGALRKVYDAGYALIDASIDNILVDRTEGLKLIDFEFAHRYEHKPATFESAYDIAGPPSSFTGDQPIQGGNSYDRNWRPYIGLSLHSLLHDPTWLQHVKRATYYALHAHRFVPRLLRHYVRQALGTSHPAHLGQAVPAGITTDPHTGADAERSRERRAA